MAGFDQRQAGGQASKTEGVQVENEIGHVLCAKMRSHEFKAKQSGGLAIVAAKQKMAKARQAILAKSTRMGFK